MKETYKTKRITLDLDDYTDEFEALKQLAKDDDRSLVSYSRRLFLDAIIKKILELKKTVD